MATALRPALALMTDEQLTYMAHAPYAKVVDYIGHRNDVTLIIETAAGRAYIAPDGTATPED